MNPQELLINVLREKDIRLATVVSQRSMFIPPKIEQCFYTRGSLDRKASE